MSAPPHTSTQTSTPVLPPLGSIVREALKDVENVNVADTLSFLASMGVTKTSDLDMFLPQDLEDLIKPIPPMPRSKLREPLAKHIKQAPQGPGSGAQATLALPPDFFDRLRNSVDFEGLKDTPWALARRELCEKLIKLVDQHKRVLVRGPFGSGKTALAQLLHYHLREVHKHTYIVTLAGYSGNWENVWAQQAPVRWTDIINSAKPVYVIIDEVQKSYPATSESHGLWGYVKNTVGMSQQVRYFCIGSYGDPDQAVTPVDFPEHAIVSLRSHNGTPGLVYNQQEYMDLLKLFHKSGGFEIDERSANYLLHWTGSHPGIIGFILKLLLEFASNFASKDEATEQLYAHLHSADLYQSLRSSSSRTIPNFGKYDSIDDACKFVLNSSCFKAKLPFPMNLKKQLNECLKASILVVDGEFVMFSSPVVQDRAMAYFFSETREAPDSLDSFIGAVVQHFSIRKLHNTKGKDTLSRIMEGQWQDEFSRAAATLLPMDVIMSSEYGREQGVAGQVDFYIAQYDWFIEVLWDGIAMNAHEQRFLPKGRYAPLLTQNSEWAVIDFRKAKQEVRREPHKHTYHVSFAEDHSTVSIQYPDGNTKAFPLLGDVALETGTNRIPGSTPAKLKPVS
eukprot:Phypoly_transcript_04507.p1 GENE.Phypoly_transcript_04507~~Phypoly_transcript_04507.p1  ORF type:complete len:621 (+),score=65.51 Phypoly_transcript_04507:209-2071(+)